MERLGKAGELPMETAGWPLECERVLLMATMTTAIFLNESPPTASLERIFDTPDGTVARYLAQLAEMNGRAEGSKQELKRDLISDTAPAGAVGVDVACE